MGCAVNGPGEAKNATSALPAATKEALLFKKGRIIRKLDEKTIVDELFKEIERL